MCAVFWPLLVTHVYLTAMELQFHCESMVQMESCHPQVSHHSADNITTQWPFMQGNQWESAIENMSRPISRLILNLETIKVKGLGWQNGWWLTHESRLARNVARYSLLTSVTQQNRNNISHLHSYEYFWTLFETTSLLMIQTKANTTPCFMPDAFPTTIQSYKFILGWQRHWVTLVCISHNLVVKQVAHTRLPTVGFRSWSWFLAVSLQVTWVINLAVGCHYFPP